MEKVVQSNVSWKSGQQAKACANICHHYQCHGDRQKKQYSAGTLIIKLKIKYLLWSGSIQTKDGWMDGWKLRARHAHLPSKSPVSATTVVYCFNWSNADDIFRLLATGSPEALSPIFKLWQIVLHKRSQALFFYSQNFLKPGPRPLDHAHDNH